MANSTIKRIRGGVTATIDNVTTTAAGNILTDITVPILCAWSYNNPDYIILPWKSKTTGKWYFHVLSTSGVVAANVSIDKIAYVYLE